MSVVMMIRGTPSVDRGNPLRAVLGVGDDDGNEQRVQVVFKGISPPTNKARSPQPEALYSIADPMEKEIDSVLQAELSRYDKFGRTHGAFGSIYLVHQNNILTSFARDYCNLKLSAEFEIEHRFDIFKPRIYPVGQSLNVSAIRRQDALSRSSFNTQT